MTDGQHIRQLTGLRFLAAMWVVLYHYWPKMDGPALPGFVAKGYLGVELFFVLSGFILCHVYRQSVAEGGFRYGAFLWNRLARVYPLHLATLVGMIGLGLAAGAAGLAVDPGLTDWASLLANLFLVQAWGVAPSAAFNHPSWSISAEWFAYLSFPVFAWASLALKDRPWLATGLAAAFLVGLYAAFERLAGFPLTEATIRWGALRIVPCFALGCALHALWRARPASDRRSALLMVLIAAVTVTLVASLHAPDALIVITLGGLILALARLGQAGSELFGGRAFVYLGEVSYSIYMICIPWAIVFVNAAAKVLHLPEDRLPIPVWMVFFCSVVPLASASYHLIEKPARERMKLWADLWRTRRLAAAGA